MTTKKDIEDTAPVLVQTHVPREVYDWLCKTAHEQGDVYADSLIARILQRAYNRR